MKHLSLILVSYVFLLVYCKKEDPAPPKPEYYWGLTYALKNGKNWISDPFARVNNLTGKDLFLVSNLLTRNLVIVEVLTISKLPFTPGRYRVYNSDLTVDDGKVGAAFYYQEDDLPLGDYGVDEADTTNYIELISYDSLSREIKGRFNLSFKVLYKPANVSIPDTVVLRNGTFHTRILQ